MKTVKMLQRTACMLIAGITVSGLFSLTFSQVFDQDKYKHAPGAAIFESVEFEHLGEPLSGSPEVILDFNGNIVAGGAFFDAGEVRVNGIATLIDEEWHPMGEGFRHNVVQAAVFCMIDFNGVLYAGGRFHRSGSVETLHVARWSNNAWIPVGNGFNDIVRDFTIYNGHLIAAGMFTESGETEINRIARWSGASWQPLGEGFDNEVQAVTVYDGELIAAGRFSFSGETQVRRIARWDGSSWQPLGDGWGDLLNAFTVHDDVLFVGGFTSTGIAVRRWDGENWSATGALQRSFQPRIYSLVTYNGEVYAGGLFNNSGPRTLNNIARWDGSLWQPVGEGIPWDGNVKDIIVFQDDLHLAVGGAQVMPGEYIARVNMDAVSVEGPDNDLANSVRLFQNYPNPFNPSTEISFELPESSEIHLEVLNLMGQSVAVLAEGTRPAGRHTVSFEASGIASGVYIYRLTAGGAVKVRMMTLLK